MHACMCIRTNLLLTLDFLFSWNKSLVLRYPQTEWSFLSEQTWAAKWKTWQTCCQQFYPHRDKDTGVLCRHRESRGSLVSIGILGHSDMGMVIFKEWCNADHMDSIRGFSFSGGTVRFHFIFFGMANFTMMLFLCCVLDFNIILVKGTQFSIASFCCYYCLWKNKWCCFPVVTAVLQRWSDCQWPTTQFLHWPAMTQNFPSWLHISWVEFKILLV